MNQVQVSASLELMKNYEDNWDGNDGIKPSLEAIRLAKTISFILLEKDIYIDEVDADANGRAAIYLKNEDRIDMAENKYAVVYIDNNGNACVIANNEGEIISFGPFNNVDSVCKIKKFLE